MLPRKKRWIELAQQSDYFGEQATLLYLDGRFELALDAANRAVDASGKLYKRDSDNPDVAEVHADGLRNRAEIQSVWAQTLHMVNTESASALIRGGITDATRALTLYENPAAASAGRYPTRSAEVRLTLSELHALVGDIRAARRNAELSMVDYRRHHNAGDRRDDLADDLSFARALSRYASVVTTTAETDPAKMGIALAARRESIELSRPHARPDGWLWLTRFDRGLTWLSTQTLERFCRTAYLHATQPGPANAEPTMAEALIALQDAAEGYTGLIRHISPVLDPPLEQFWHASDALRQLETRLRAIDEPDLADAYRTAKPTLATPTAGGWHAMVAQLRAPLQVSLQRLGHAG